jgi:hypothetical protein
LAQTFIQPLLFYLIRVDQKKSHNSAVAIGRISRLSRSKNFHYLFIVQTDVVAHQTDNPMAPRAENGRVMKLTMGMEITINRKPG